MIAVSLVDLAGRLPPTIHWKISAHSHSPIVFGSALVTSVSEVAFDTYMKFLTR
jgi:hypothetical protein